MNRKADELALGELLGRGGDCAGEKGDAEEMVAAECRKHHCDVDLRGELSVASSC